MKHLAAIFRSWRIKWQNDECQGSEIMFPPPEKWFEQFFNVFWKTILNSVSSPFAILGSDLRTEFHKLFTKCYVVFWSWVKPVVRPAPLKPPASSVNLDKPNKRSGSCAVRRKYHDCDCLVEKGDKAPWECRESCEQFGHWLRKRTGQSTLVRNDEAWEGSACFCRSQLWVTEQRVHTELARALAFLASVGFTNLVF